MAVALQILHNFCVPTQPWWCVKRDGEERDCKQEGGKEMQRLPYNGALRAHKLRHSVISSSFFNEWWKRYSVSLHTYIFIFFPIAKFSIYFSILFLFSIVWTWYKPSPPTYERLSLAYKEIALRLHYKYICHVERNTYVGSSSSSSSRYCVNKLPSRG